MRGYNFNVQFVLIVQNRQYQIGLQKHFCYYSDDEPAGYNDSSTINPYTVTICKF